MRVLPVQAGVDAERLALAVALDLHLGCAALDEAAHHLQDGLLIAAGVGSHVENDAVHVPLIEGFQRLVDFRRDGLGEVVEVDIAD